MAIGTGSEEPSLFSLPCRPVRPRSSAATWPGASCSFYSLAKGSLAATIRTLRLFRVSPRKLIDRLNPASGRTRKIDSRWPCGYQYTTTSRSTTTSSTTTRVPVPCRGQVRVGYKLHLPLLFCHVLNAEIYAAPCNERCNDTV